MQYRKAGFMLLGICVCALSHAKAESILSTATATIVEPLSITNTTPLIFGYITQGGGKVTIDVHNKRIVTGDVVLDESVAFARASVMVTGKSGAHYTIMTPKRLSFKRKNAPANAKNTALTATDFQSYSVNAQKVGEKGVLSESGKDTIYVGGTLIVPKTAEAGHYSGHVLLTLSY